MVMVAVDDSSIQADSQPSQVAWSEGQRPFGTLLHSRDEPSELSQ